MLLVIDNFERLLAPANPDRYDFVDPSVHGFLREFQQAAGLSSILALSRVAIDSLELDQGAIINLGALERSEVLAMLQAYGLEGTDEELGAGKSLFDWHPLLLRVAVRYASAKEMALDRLFVGDLPHEARPGSGLNELLDRYDELLRPNAVQLLCLLTQCRPQSSKAFIRPMLEKCGVSPAALLLPSPDEAASVVEQLRRLQLVQLVGSYISVHPSVREYYRQRFQKLP